MGNSSDVIAMIATQITQFGHRSLDRAEIFFFRESLLTWRLSFSRNFPWRQNGASRYTQIVSEVLLQRTRAETVSAFWPTFIGRYPSWRAIARSTVAEVREALQPLGLAEQRAPRLHALATIIAARNGRFPKTREALEALPGVGQYIANAIFTFCHGAPKPLLDVNMARVVERFFGPRKLSDIRHDPYLQELTAHLVGGSAGKHLNWAILDFAAATCTASRPRCTKCPVAGRCRYLKTADFNSREADGFAER